MQTEQIQEYLQKGEIAAGLAGLAGIYYLLIEYIHLQLGTPATIAFSSLNAALVSIAALFYIFGK